MDHLYKQVFNNKFLKNKIYSHITEHNKENRYIRYNYYDFPFELVLKTKNQPLLIEKLNNYNQYFGNNCNNNNNSNNDNDDNNNDSNSNNNNNKIKNVEKYFLNFNKSSLMNLFEGEELELELFEHVFKTFEKEIKEMKRLITSREAVVVPYFIELIKNHSLEKIKFLIDNEYLKVIDIENSLIFVCQRLFSNNFNGNGNDSGSGRSSSSKKKVVTMDKSTIETKKIKLFNYLFKEIKVDLPTQKIVSMLMDVVYENQIETYGEMLINQLPDQLPENDGYNVNRLDHFTTFTSLLITRNIWSLFNLLLNKYRVEVPIVATTAATTMKEQSIEEEIVIINNIPIKVKTLKHLQFSPSVILNKCSNLELVKVLLKSFPEVYLNPIHFGGMKVISYPNVALYLVENHFKLISIFDFSISWPCYYKLREMGLLSLVSLPVTEYYSDDPQFKEIIANDINTIQQLPNSLNEQPILIKQLMKLDDIKVIKQFLLRFPRNFSFKTIERLVLSIKDPSTDEDIRNKRIEILNHLKQHLLDGNYPYLHETRLREKICDLLIFSIENNEKELFDVVLVLLNRFQEQKDYEIYYSTISNWVRNNHGIARKWLLNSSFHTFFKDIVDRNLQTLLNKKTHKYKSLHTSSSKFLIGEFTSRDPLIEPFNLSLDSISTTRTNIIHFALINDIILNGSSSNNHQKIEFFQMTNEKIIKPFYDKGFFKNLLLHNFSWLQKTKGNSFFFNRVLFKILDFGYLRNEDIKIALNVLNSINKSQLVDEFYLLFNTTNLDQFDKISNLFK
ncbi:hypothetical protein ACTFIR_008850 [Dictyostelium discoideum]